MLSSPRISILVASYLAGVGAISSQRFTLTPPVDTLSLSSLLKMEPGHQFKFRNTPGYTIICRRHETGAHMVWRPDNFRDGSYVGMIMPRVDRAEDARHAAKVLEAMELLYGPHAELDELWKIIEEEPSPLLVWITSRAELLEQRDAVPLSHTAWVAYMLMQSLGVGESTDTPRSPEPPAKSQDATGVRQVQEVAAEIIPVMLTMGEGFDRLIEEIGAADDESKLRISDEAGQGNPSMLGSLASMERALVSTAEKVKTLRRLLARINGTGRSSEE